MPRPLAASFCAALLAVCLPAAAQEGEPSKPAEGYASPRVDFGITVSDAEKSRAFYEKALGLRRVREFTVSGDLAGKIGLTASQPLVVHVLQLGEGPDATAVKLVEIKGVRPSRPDKTFIHSTYGVNYLTFYVTDLDAALKRAAEHKVEPLAEGAADIPADIAEGMAIALVRDPDGNLIELVGPRGKK